MRLASISIQYYRSIKKTPKIKLKSSTVLIGPNNEGKSNILRALVTALSILGSYRRMSGKDGRTFVYMSSERYYSWDRDFPISYQKNKPDGRSIFELEFELDDSEIQLFKKNVKSNLNGTLPVRIEIDSDSKVEFKVTKRGPGGPALSKKAALIGQFISDLLKFEYIPAVRTAEAAQKVVDDIVDRELRKIEEDQGYLAALEKIAEFQKPLLDTLGTSLYETLKDFLPNIRNVKVQLPQRERMRRTYRGYSEIIIDDGTPTLLQDKGDGVQSLAALSLLRFASEKAAGERELILAIEEPESHLHPRAIHTLKKVIEEIGRTQQVILTSHCPLFVDRSSVESNIIVQTNKARPAKSITEIRNALGVRASDNLRNAEIVLLVEGEDDRISISALLKHYSVLLAESLGDGLLALDTLNGVSSLTYKFSTLVNSICSPHAFIDNDPEGRRANDRATDEGVAEIKDITFASCKRMANSELEDFYEHTLYFEAVRSRFNVDFGKAEFRHDKEKWCDRAKQTFKAQGRAWSEEIERDLKLMVAKLVAENPGAAVHSSKISVLESLISVLEAKVKVLRS